MAKRKKKTHRVHHRRRRMSGAGGGFGNDAMEVLGMVGGAVLTVAVQRTMVHVSPKIVAGAGLVGGFLLKKHGHSALMQGAAAGIMTTSAVHLSHDVGLLNGVESFVSGLYGDGGMIESEHEMRGISNNDTMTGISNNAMMSGDQYDDYMSM